MGIQKTHNIMYPVHIRPNQNFLSPLCLFLSEFCNKYFASGKVRDYFGNSHSGFQI